MSAVLFAVSAVFFAALAVDTAAAESSTAFLVSAFSSRTIFGYASISESDSSIPSGKVTLNGSVCHVLTAPPSIVFSNTISISTLPRSVTISGRTYVILIVSLSSIFSTVRSSPEYSAKSLSGVVILIFGVNSYKSFLPCLRPRINTRSSTRLFPLTPIRIYDVLGAFPINSKIIFRYLLRRVGAICRYVYAPT